MRIRPVIDPFSLDTGTVPQTVWAKPGAFIWYPYNAGSDDLPAAAVGSVPLVPRGEEGQQAADSPVAAHHDHQGSLWVQVGSPLKLVIFLIHVFFVANNRKR